MTYDEALEVVLGREGGLSDRKNDRGGRTMAGVTQAVYDRWRDRQGLPRQDVAKSTPEERRELYRVEYWDVCRAEEFAPVLRLVHFDHAVNAGPGRAIRHLQLAARVPSDGIVGPKTRAACEARPEWVARRLFVLREHHYLRLAEVDPTQREHFRGWIARLSHVRTVTLNRHPEAE